MQNSFHLRFGSSRERELEDEIKRVSNLLQMTIAENRYMKSELYKIKKQVGLYFKDLELVIGKLQTKGRP